VSEVSDAGERIGESTSAKGSPRPNVEALMPYYQDLVQEFFPHPLRW
jgi:Myo-inositol oxygenase